MPVELDRETQKEAVKEATTERLDTRFAALGRWRVRGVVAVGLAGLLYAYLVTHGYKV